MFLLKRHEKSSFMGGNFVYPGGRVDREDGSLEICSFSKGITLEEAQNDSWEGRSLLRKASPTGSQAFGNSLKKQECFSPMIKRGSLFQLKGQEEQEKVFKLPKFDFKRIKSPFARWHRKKNFYFALDQLHYYAHWITPEARSERFDTRFFLAHYPLGQEATS